MINIKHININMLNINHYMYGLSQIIWPNKNDYDNVDDHLKAFNDSFLYVINAHAAIRFLHLAANVIASPMCEILNRSITECTFPAIWKTARVIPVHKGSAKDNTNNCRPSSLL